MKSTNKGDKFESLAFLVLSHALNHHKLGISPNSARIYQKKAYFSKERSSNIIADISIEIFVTGQNEPSIIWIFECKDYDTSIPVSDVEEFHAKLQQIGSDNTKGTIVTKSNLQGGAMRYARSNKIGFIKFSNDSWKVVIPVFAGVSGFSLIEAAEGFKLSNILEQAVQKNSVKTLTKQYKVLISPLAIVVLCLLSVTIIQLGKNASKRGSSAARQMQNPQEQINILNNQTNDSSNQKPIDSSQEVMFLGESLSLTGEGGENVVIVEDSYDELDKASNGFLSTKTRKSVELNTVMVDLDRLHLIIQDPSVSVSYSLERTVRLEESIYEGPLEQLLRYVYNCRVIAETDRNSVLSTAPGGSSAGMSLEKRGINTTPVGLNESTLKCFSKIESITIVSSDSTETMRYCLGRLDGLPSTNAEAHVLTIQQPGDDEGWVTKHYVIRPPVSVSDLKLLAANGNSDALVRLARKSLQDGDASAALGHYQAAIEKGNLKAHRDLGRLLVLDVRFPRDLAYATKLLTIAANSECYDCPLLLAKIHFEALNDPSRAVLWLKEGAHRGDSEAKNTLEQIGQNFNIEDYYVSRTRLIPGTTNKIIKPYDGVD